MKCCMSPWVNRFGNMKGQYVVLAGEAKPSVDGEEERIQVRHGDNEFASGINYPRNLNVARKIQNSVLIGVYLLRRVNRRKGGNVGRGMGRKLTMIFIKRL